MADKYLSTDPNAGAAEQPKSGLQYLSTDSKAGEMGPSTKVATTLHRDEGGRTLSFPHMAVPDNPEAQSTAMSALMMGASGPALEGAAALPGLAGRATRAVLARPAVAGAIGNALPELARGDIGGALKSATVGALMGKILGFRPGAPMAAAEAVPAAEVAAVESAPTVSNLMKKGLPEGPEAMRAVADHIVEWRTKFKMSGPQIVNALREQYGIAAKEGNILARQIISSLQD